MVLKRKEWEAKIPLEQEEGLQLLAASLLHTFERNLMNLRTMVENAKRKRDGLPIPKDYHVNPENVDLYEVYASKAQCDVKELRAINEELCVQEETKEKAKSTKVEDFRWRWDHFLDHSILIRRLKPDLPDTVHLKEIPIAETESTELVKALHTVLFVEFDRLTRNQSEDRVPPSTDQEWGLYWATYELHAEPRKVGHPRGRRWEDGFINALAYATSILLEEERHGEPISREEAIRRALREFRIIDPRDFVSEPDKESVIVASGGRKQNAIKALRKALEEHDKALKQFASNN